MEHIFTGIAGGIAAFTGRPLAFILALGAVIVWAVTGPIFGFSETWQLVINTGTTIVTFLMVFLVQNSQNRDAAALQAKLDELIRALEGARNHFIGIEHMTDREIEKIRKELEAECDGGRRAPSHEIDRAHARPPLSRGLVGATGFEPATCGTQNRRATRLRHAPTRRASTAARPAAKAERRGRIRRRAEPASAARSRAG